MDWFLYDNDLRYERFKLTFLRLNLSHFSEHGFRYNFKYTINLMCSCGFEPETTDYLLNCKLYSDLILELLNDVFVAS